MWAASINTYNAHMVSQRAKSEARAVTKGEDGKVSLRECMGKYVLRFLLKEAKDRQKISYRRFPEGAYSLLRK